MFIPVRYNGVGIKPWKAMPSRGQSVEVGTATGNGDIFHVFMGAENGLLYYIEADGVDFEAPKADGTVNESIIGQIFPIPVEGTTSLGSSDNVEHGFLALAVDVARKKVIGRFI